MSYRRCIVVTCDVSTCATHSIGSWWLSEARREARKAGWLISADGDFCPAHKAVRGRVTSNAVWTRRVAGCYERDGWQICRDGGGWGIYPPGSEWVCSEPTLEAAKARVDELRERRR